MKFEYWHVRLKPYASGINVQLALCKVARSRTGLTRVLTPPIHANTKIAIRADSSRPFLWLDTLRGIQMIYKSIFWTTWRTPLFPVEVQFKDRSSSPIPWNCKVTYVGPRLKANI